MTINDLFSGINFKTKLNKNTEINNITSNSKEITGGCLFVCIKGSKFDGHDFAKTAVRCGAAAVLCERDLGIDCQIIVGDTKNTFGIICSNYFKNPSKKLKLIGVTGTNGKTTVTYLIKHILEENGFKCGLIGTIQNMVGQRVIETKLTTPDAYNLNKLFADMVKEDCGYCVMEVSSHALSQERVGGLWFEVGIFTNLTQDHLDFHGNMENYFNAKKKLFKMCKTGVVNCDDKYGKIIADGCECEIISYGIDLKADMNAFNIVYHPGGVTFDLNDINDKKSNNEINLRLPGKFSVYNALAVLSAAEALNVPIEKSIPALGTARGVKGRVEVFPTGKNFTVIIDYAHTPDGLTNVLSAMREVSKGRIVTLFGCGGDRDPDKRPKMGKAAAELSDFLIVTSDNPRSEDPFKIIEDILPGVKECDTPYVVIENRRKAIFYAIENARENDVIILAGKGHETYQILSDQIIHFDEREILAEVIGNKI